MKNLYPLLLALVCTATLSGQAEIVGTVIDTTGTTLPGANAVLLRAQDSLLTSFGTTGADGVFRMQNVPSGAYLLRVTFLGYERPDQAITVSDDDQYFGLGDVKMYPAGFLINGVEVTADRIPIRMKGDTMLYDADAFAVGENAVVEDLLRRLPGMSVNGAGQITWRGKPINEVMINGKPFFAGNSTLLTQNLDAKAITNVEVFDQKTDSEEITGIDDGNENMTVNLEMKDEFKAKIFGELFAGYGTTERYQGGGKLFRISDASQLGVLGTVNNINKVGFSGDEISGFNGSSGRGRTPFWRGGGDGRLALDDGSATGENRSIAAGINYGMGVGKNGQLTADYALFDRDQTQRSTTIEAFNRRDDRRVVESLSQNTTANYSHRLGFELRQKLDSIARLRVTGNLTLQGGDALSNDTTTVKNAGVADNDFNVRERTRNERPSGQIRLNYNRGAGGRRGFMGGGPRGRTFGARLYGSFNNNQSDLNLLTQGFEADLALPGALVNGEQVQDRRTDSRNVGGAVEFAEPLGEKWRVNLEAEAEYDNDEGDYRFRLQEQTAVNLLDRTWTTGTGTASLVHTFGKGGNLSFGTRYQRGTLTLAGDEVRDESYGFLLPFVRLRKRLKKGFFSANLSSSAAAPSVSQLQTIAEPNASGRVSVGNPELDPSRSTNFFTYLWFNDQFRALSANGNINVSYTDNAFGNEVSFVQGQQIFRTINVSHAWRGSANVGTTIGMNFINGEFRAQAGGNVSRGNGIVDDVLRINTSVNYNAGANITTELNADSYIKLGYQFNSFTNSFSGGREDANTTQLSDDITAAFELEVSPKWRFESRFLYAIYRATDFSERQTIPDLRLSLELRPFRKAGHFVRLSASDLFNQNTIVNRNVGQFSTVETTANGLGRYYLATFHYKIK